MADYIIELYRLDVSDNALHKIDIIDTYEDLSFVNILNGIGECNFQMAVQNPKLNASNFIPKRTQIVVKRDGEIVFFGPYYNYDGTYKDVNGRVTIRAYSYIYHLTTRFSDQLSSFVQTEQVSILWSLINTVQTRTNGQLLISNGTTATGVLRDQNYEYKSVAEAIIQMSDNINGFDFTFDSTVDGDGDLTGANFVTYYPAKGSVRNDLPKLMIGDNVQDFGFGISGDFYNSLTLLGAGTGTSILLSTEENSGLQTGYTRIESVQKMSDISVLSTLDDKASTFIQTNGVPTIDIRVQLNPSVRPLFTEFSLGDTLMIDIQVASSDLLHYQGQARVWGIGVSVNVNGKETVTPRLIFNS